MATSPAVAAREPRAPTRRKPLGQTRAARKGWARFGTPSPVGAFCAGIPDVPPEERGRERWPTETLRAAGTKGTTGGHRRECPRGKKERSRCVPESVLEAGTWICFSRAPRLARYKRSSKEGRATAEGAGG